MFALIIRVSNGFCDFVLSFLGLSIAAGNDETRFLTKVACPSNIYTEQYIKAVLFPRSVNWTNLHGVFFNGCGVFKSEYLRNFMFPHGIVNNMEEVVSSDEFVVDYANGFLSWLTKYSLEEIKNDCHIYELLFGSCFLSCSS